MDRRQTMPRQTGNGTFARLRGSTHPHRTIKFRKRRSRREYPSASR